MSRRRVLVVDDDDGIREIAQLSLELVGDYEVVTAGSGWEALDRVRDAMPDAILLDVMMPGLDGPGTVIRLQADPVTRDIAVVLLTAKVQQSDRSRFADLVGVSGVITKPFDPMALAGQVAAILGWEPASTGLPNTGLPNTGA